MHTKLQFFLFFLLPQRSLLCIIADVGNHNELIGNKQMIKSIIRAALFTPAGAHPTGISWGLSLLCWGPPGVGKSKIIEKQAIEWGLGCKVLSPGTDGEGAFGCTPIPENSADGVLTIKYPPPYWVDEISRGGVVFVDEINQASPALQGPIMGLTLARRIGDAYLGRRVRTIAAANPVDVAAGGWDLAPPLANRFGHLDWEAPTAESWRDYMTGGGDDAAGNEIRSAEAEEARVLTQWPESWAKAIGLFSSFIIGRASLLHVMPELGSPEMGRAWPSHRSWENATRAFASATVHGLSEVEKEVFVSAFVGQAAAAEFFAYATSLDLPDPAEVLDGKADVTFDVRRLDRIAAILAGCASLVCTGADVSGKGANQRRAQKLWEILGHPTLIKNADLIFSPARSLISKSFHRLPAATPVLTAIGPALAAAGVQHDGQ